MPSFCVVSNCEYKYAYSTNISFHKFPFHTPLLLQQWIEFVERGPSWMPSRWSRVCSCHFTPSDFKDNIYRKCLKRTACPTVKKKMFNFPTTTSFEDDELTVNHENTLALHQFQSQIIADESPPNIDPIVNYTTDEHHQQLQTTEPHQKLYEITCRLCAQTIDYSSDNIQSIDDTAIMSIFTKCFPTITLELCDHYPTKICNNCLMKLKEFSIFVERVQAVQCDFTNSNTFANQLPSVSDVIATTTTQCTTTESTTNTTVNINNNNNNSHQYISNNVTEPIISRDTSKAIVIKQEPFVNVKQEVIDFSRTGTTLRLHDNFIQNDAYCEFCEAYFINNFELKNHIVTYHSSGNASKTANNCEIMEIITLDNIMMIDLVGKTKNNQSDTIANDEEMIESPSSPIAMPCPATILKVETLNDLEQRENLTKFVLTEHNYCKVSMINENLPILACKPVVKVLKQEDGIQMHHQQQQQQLHQIVNVPQSTPNFQVFESFVEHESRIESDSQHLDVIEEVVADEHNVFPSKICQLCNLEFHDIYKYLLHKKTYHFRSGLAKKWISKRFSATCQDCSGMFHTKLAFKNHRNFMCPVKRGVTYQCPYCRLNFLQWLVMRQHSKKCCIGNASQTEGSFLKDIGVQCDTTSNHSLSMSRYACEQCGRCYIRRSNLRRHKALHRPREQWDEKCTHCGTVFDKRLDLTRHISLGDCPNADKSINCPICNKKFRTPKGLHQHKFTHSEERPYKCTMCTNVYKRIAGLNQHIRGFHHKIKPHKCPVCKHRYALKGDLNRCRHSSLNIFY